MPGQVDIPTVSDLSVEEICTQVVTTNDPRHEGQVIHGTLTEFTTGFDTIFLLLLDQQPGNDLGSMFKSHVNVSSAVLKAAAHHYGSQCDKPNKEFMLCRWEEKDPRKCLEEGRRVNECALNFFRQIKGNCSESFTEYWTCLDYSGLAELRHCRKQQKVFDECVLEKLGWERPELGDLSKVTKVATSRPLPENPYHSRPRPEPNPVIDAPLEPAKHGSRLFFWNW